jgi:hypothetical protein
MKKNVSNYIVGIAALFSAAQVVAEQGSPHSLSVVQLLANPDKYQNQLVMVTGFCRIEFEGNAVYLHQDDYTYGNTKNGLWLSINPQKVGVKFEKGHCLVVGRFDAKNQGHMGLFSGSLNNISRLEPWPPEQPIQ